MHEKEEEGEEEVSEQEVMSKGTRVHYVFWDGGPGGGAQYDEIYHYQGKYWTQSYASGFEGPYDTMDEALSGEFLGVSNAVERIENDELSTRELVDRLTVHGADPGHVVEINDEEWEVQEDGTLAPVDPDDSDSSKDDDE